MGRIRRTALGAALIGVLLLSTSAGAGALRCRTDPTLLLSDGTVLDLAADVDAPLWDVSNVSYSIRLPAGVSAIAVVRTPNWPTTKETFSVVSDGPRGVFDTTTVVRTGTGGVAVTANLVVVKVIALGAASTTGTSGQPLSAVVQIP